ncbi:hypothetical protein WISP_136019 [Willisornis vidua]|uniref:Reverse transcriptase domain-containing protein n=1 Tax=Willisornis vidua TaxID=1566151 RepID=A0ABQ9CUB4_9PASS|nr:hypothetical protein WISP_136019 [Willisornis vidua]
MRELVEDVAKSLSIIYQQSWPTGEVPDDWELVNITLIHKNGCDLAVDEGKAVDVVYVDISKTFDTVSHNILVENLTATAWTSTLSAGLGTGWMAQ